MFERVCVCVCLFAAQSESHVSCLTVFLVVVPGRTRQTRRRCGSATRFWLRNLGSSTLLLSVCRTARTVKYVRGGPQDFVLARFIIIIICNSPLDQHMPACAAIGNNDSRVTNALHATTLPLLLSCTYNVSWNKANSAAPTMSMAEFAARYMGHVNLTDSSDPRYVFQHYQQSHPVLSESIGRMSMAPITAVLNCLPQELQDYLHLPPAGMPGAWTQWTIGMGGSGSGAPFHMHDVAVNIVLKARRAPWLMVVGGCTCVVRSRCRRVQQLMWAGRVVDGCCIWCCGLLYPRAFNAGHEEVVCVPSHVRHLFHRANLRVSARRVPDPAAASEAHRVHAGARRPCAAPCVRAGVGGVGMLLCALVWCPSHAKPTSAISACVVVRNCAAVRVSRGFQTPGHAVLGLQRSCATSRSS